MQARQERQTIRFGQYKGKTCAEVWAEDRRYAEWVFDQPRGNCDDFKAFQGWVLRAKARIAYGSSNPEEARAALAVVRERFEGNREIQRDDRLYCTYKLEDIANASLEREASEVDPEETRAQAAEAENRRAEAEAEIAGIRARQEINERDMLRRRVMAEQERELAEQERLIEQEVQRTQMYEKGAALYHEARRRVVGKIQERVWPKTETSAVGSSAARSSKEVAPSETTSSGGTGKLHLPPKPREDPGVDPDDFTWKHGYAESSESSKTVLSKTSTSRPATSTELADYPEDETPEQSKVRQDSGWRSELGQESSKQRISIGKF